jgi:hypothetical protein
VGVGDDTDSATSSGTTDDVNPALDAPDSGDTAAADIPLGANDTADPDAADGSSGTDDTGGNDGADSRVVVDSGAFSVDARGKLTCPTIINGSITTSDATQIGRLSRYAPTSVCGTAKGYPGNQSDTTYSHLYDAYHFINTTGAPACFNFTLTYPGSAQLYAVAYSPFDPTDITTGYLGDVGGVLASPQTMGISIDAGATIDVVVLAAAAGTTAAGSYALSCSTE